MQIYFKFSVLKECGYIISHIQPENFHQNMQNFKDSIRLLGLTVYFSYYLRVFYISEQEIHHHKIDRNLTCSRNRKKESWCKSKEVEEGVKSYE